MMRLSVRPTFVGFLFFSLTMTSVKPVKDPVPAVAAATAFVALAGGGMYALHRNYFKGNKHEFTRRNIAGSIALAGGSFLVSRYLYRHLKSTTPLARYFAALDLVEGNTSNDQDPLLEALTLVRGVYDEVVDNSSQKALHDKAIDLIQVIAHKLEQCINDKIAVIRDDEAVFAYISDDADGMSDAGFIQDVLGGSEYVFPVVNAFERAVGTMHEIVRAQQAFVENFADVVEELENGAALFASVTASQTVMSRIMPRAQKRLALLQAYQTNVQAKKLVTSLREHAKLSFLYEQQHALSDEAFVARAENAYSSARWYRPAKRDLVHHRDQVSKMRRDLSRLVTQARVYPFSAELTASLTRLREYHTCITRMHNLTDKYDVISTEREAFKEISDDHVFGQLLRPEYWTMTDERVWQWADRHFSRRSAFAISSIEKKKKQLSDSFKELQRVRAFTQGMMLNDECSQLIEKVQAAAKTLGIKKELLALRDMHDEVKRRIDSFVDQCRFYRFLQRDQEYMSVARMIQLLRNSFSQVPWPLLDAKDELDRAISNCADIIQRASRVHQQVSQQPEVAALATQSLGLQQEALRISNVLVMRRADLITSREYAAQEAERAAYHRNREQQHASTNVGQPPAYSTVIPNEAPPAYRP